MMLTIYGLPPNIKYHELKGVIKKECNINEFILGSLWVDKDGTKNVKIGLTNDHEGKVLLKCLDGYQLSGYILRIVPVRKAVNEHREQDTFNDTSYQWRSNQQENDHGSNLTESNQNRSQIWRQGSSLWIRNQPTVPQQMQSQSNLGYMQSSQEMQQSFYHQQGSNALDKAMNQQYKFPQTKNFQHQPFGHDKNVTMNVCPNSIPSQRGSESRPHVLTNIVLTEQHTTIQPIHGGRSSTQSYNNLDKPQHMIKNNFQGSFNMNPQSDQLQQGHYQGQDYNQQWPTHGQQHKIEQFPKFSSSQMDNLSFSNKLHSDKRQEVMHDQVTTVDYKQYEKGGRRFSPQHEERSVRRISPPGHRVSPSGHRILPSGRRISPPPSRVQSSDRRMSPTGRNISPVRRRVSPPGHRISPPGRRISPGHRISSPGRRISPGHGSSRSGHRIHPSSGRNSPGGRRISPGRKMSPSRRRVTPPTHRISPSRKDFPADDSHMPRRPSPRRMSPVKPSLSRKMSPSRHSPNRRGNSPRGYSRYSPPRIGKQMDSSRQGSDKDMRKAYSTLSQAQSQPMYSGGYPTNAPENVQYPMSTSRQIDQRPVWQDREKFYPSSKKPDEDRCDMTRNQKFDAPRGQDYQRTLLNQSETKVHSPNRMSHSPNRRDRSPIRDRYRRQSPSPRSPRRSWALEKRRSSDNAGAPLPPIWPERHDLDKERDTKKHHWEKPYSAKDNLSVSRKEERRSHDREDRKYFTSSSRSRWDNTLQDSSSPTKESRGLSPSLLRSDDFYTIKHRESRFSNRGDYDINRSEHQRKRRSREPEPHGRDNSNESFNKIHRRGDEYHVADERRGTSHSRRENFNTEIEDLFKRAAEFTQKTEEYQRHRYEKGSYFKSVDHYHSKNNRDDGSGPPRHDFYETPKSRYDRSPEHVREVRNTELSPKIQYKRDKAIDDLADKILQKFGSHLKGKVRNETEERIKFTIKNIIFDMFGGKDVSFIEIVIKFNDQYSLKDMKEIFDGALSEFPAEIRRMQQFTSDESPIPAKPTKRNPSPGIRKDNKQLFPETSVSDWNLSAVIPSPAMVPQMPFITPVPMVVPVPFTYREPIINSMMPEQSQNGFYLFLYKDNFQVFNDTQALLLKNYIVDKIVKATVSGYGWTPDLTLRGILHKIRYEVWTGDELSKNWLINLDFKDFSYFNVLVYTPEELWYERAAIWLPGHSKNNILSPLVKLKLQNKHLEDVNIHTWKLVKQIITQKGTRLYVDIPPSSTRALERNNKTLSYELQKVNVFLKSVAIDKNAFDAGLAIPSVTVVPDAYKQNEAMPAINSQDANIVKMCLSNNTINVSIALRIKDALINRIYEYIQKGGESRTDFLKYGYCKPGYFCVIPENEETAKWVNSIDIGKINGNNITICGSRPVNVQYITMTALLPPEQNLTPKKVIEKLKLSNRGVKGLKFNLWKNGYICPANMNKLCYRIDVDFESIEALVDLNFLLDYSVESRTETIFIKCNIPVLKLNEIIDRYKAENVDVLTVTNMDISSSNEDDDEIVCLN